MIRAFAVAALVAAGACSGDESVVCGAGTRALDGECVATVSVDESTCGPGTHYEPLASACAPDVSPTVCGSCTIAQEAGDGTVTCVCGRDPGELCGPCQLPPCVVPSPGRASVCGVIQNLATGDVVDPTGVGELCDLANPTDDGACSLVVRFFDALELAGDPDGARPLEAGSVELRDCGGFSAHDLELPFNGTIAIVVDDAAGDAHLPSVTYVQPAAGQRRQGVVAGLAAREADAAWTASAGDPLGGQSFGERGAVFARFVRAGTRAAGVEVTCAGEPCPDAHYFADEDPWTATAIDPAATDTAPDGAALWTERLRSRGARGGIPADCAWPAPSASPIPGYVAYEELAAHRADDPTTPCE